MKENLLLIEGSTNLLRMIIHPKLVRCQKQS